MSDDQRPFRRALATVYLDVVLQGEADSFLVAETPTEARAIIEAGLEAGERFVELTLGNPPGEVDDDVTPWNGRPVALRPDRVLAITPPLDVSDDD